jgi:hypothetical protein
MTEDLMTALREYLPRLASGALVPLLNTMIMSQVVLKNVKT